ncbi:PIN domain-containing protein (plasmid) [Streptomyces sp. A2-16]|uniref:type II toxin-antitoxin system VapC family toxin n=1 Tax=Streptomyces sp. A2-16 TaxID=2781734 RepID=UPI001BB00F8F|nr:PIN domain-containing protein [Streptomyces sp. A2-16]QUC63809.1 PIN domain-containing protein [Streptomyces sp. A2-16]
MIVVDTGPLVALVSPSDDNHAKCRAWFDSLVTRRLLIVPCTVVAEACFMIQKYGGTESEALFLEDLAAGAYGIVTNLVPEDLTRMAALVRQYATLPLGGTDASVIAIAERIGTREVATIDLRHFTTVRDRNGSAFTLLPTPS